MSGINNENTPANKQIPKKGILKSPPPPSSRFPFTLNPINDLFEKLSRAGDDEHLQQQPQSKPQPQQSHHNSQDSTFWGGFKKLLSEGPAEAIDTAKSIPNKLQQQVTPTENTSAPPTHASQPTATHHPPHESIKRVSFHVPSMSVTYPIHAALPPADSRAHRAQVEAEYRHTDSVHDFSYWTADEGAQLIQIYRDACRLREEIPRAEIIEQLRSAALMRESSRTLDLSGVHLFKENLEPLADVLSIRWGLQRLILEDVGLVDESMKPVLHALLISAELPWLSIANNKMIKEKGWKLLSMFMKRAQHLTYIDLSENIFDKKSAEMLMSALARPEKEELKDEERQQRVQDQHQEHDKDQPLIPSPALLRYSQYTHSNISTVRLEGCTFKSGALEAIAQGMKNSALMHLSLRRNKISSNGVVSLALMLKDYVDPSTTESLSSDPFSKSSPPQAPRRPDLATNRNNSYRNSMSFLQNFNFRQRSKLEDDEKETPVISSPSGSVTTRIIPSIQHNEQTGQKEDSQDGNIESHFISRRLEDSQDKVEVPPQPRVDIGSGLITLDLKGNDIRSSVNYIATVLKRNKTLKVLNLSENRIDYRGLLSISEALKHNKTLETLDLSKNPCCGPEADGITSLRTSFAVNSNMKRLFLADTQLQSEGAIALAEFLPEAKTLLHVDLTDNNLTMSGLLALSVAVKMNNSIRCLDISIPINDPDMANLSQDILQSCIRNTEAAQEKSGKSKNLFGPIQRSVLAKKLQEAEVQQSTAAVVAAAESPEGIARARVWNQTPQETLVVSQEILKIFTEIFDKREKEPGNEDKLAALQTYIHERRLEVKALKDRLMELIGEELIENENEINLALSLNDQLAGLNGRIEDSVKLSEQNAILARQQAQGAAFLQPKKSNHNRARSLSLNDEMSNPQFQIMGSDDSDVETEADPESTSIGGEGGSLKQLPPKPKLEISTEIAKQDDESTPKPALNGEEVKSPTSDLGRSQLFEEGEIFRKGIALLNEERIESEEDGEALRKEILETELPSTSPKSPTSPKPEAPPRSS
ncbi:hypothetical protein E3P81_03309 [Wallemia ichthyophaga]|nr:hypothetical protein E3P97_03310 [Wallemia ichthyophaga]TIB28586.1 hypothetical protein E3P85_03581 [Wallemia ichthyophaga]TIB44861.1 hypothetical protein E3P82_03278 [Wallemia ichthyophaga]TIB47373.1 hypothetical protein E3P81_03309 [Wallemia ichthyophaga]TIB50448.1 hypothetical protein E3P80_03282 [Wallemia ichthyophaga]